MAVCEWGQGSRTQGSVLECGDDHDEGWVSAGKVDGGQVTECFECHTGTSGYL